MKKYEVDESQRTGCLIPDKAIKIVDGTHLRYNFRDSPQGHPQKVMKELGIVYQDCTPQSMGDQWWFWNCQNIPYPLPKYLEVADLDPMKCIGYGLSKEDAEKIINWKP